MASKKRPENNETQKARERWDSEGGAAAKPEEPTRRQKAWDDAKGQHWHGAASTDETQARSDAQVDDRQERSDSEADDA